MREKKNQYILDDLLRIILAMFVLTALFAFSCLLLSHGARGIWLAVLALFALLGVLGGVFLRRCLRIVQKNEQVMQLYAEAAYAEASIGLAAQKLDESRQLLTRTQRMMELGTKSRPDVAQIEAQVAEDDYALTHQRNEATRTLLALKAAMNFPADSAMAIDCSPTALWRGSAEQAMGSGDAGTDNAAAICSAFESVSPELATALADERSARYSWLQQRGALLPSVSIEGGISTNYYQNLSQKGSVDAFATQLKNNRGEYFGISLSIPIFTASSWRAARRAKSNWQQAQLKLDDTRRRLHDDIFQAVMDRDGYVKEVAQMVRKVASDSLAHHLNARKYDEGMLSTFELHTSSQTPLQSKIKLLQMQLLLAIKQRLVDYYKGDLVFKP